MPRSCPCCASEWIDPGKVKLVMRHFPSDGIATHASLLAECAGPARFYDLVDALFRAQIDWLTASDPDAEMIKVLVGQGIGAEAATPASPTTAF